MHNLTYSGRKKYSLLMLLTMNTGLIILLLVGIILMTANAAKSKETASVPLPSDVPIDPATGQPLPAKVGNAHVIYKYIPMDLDEFFRQDAVSKPSKLYYSMFNTDPDLRA